MMPPIISSRPHSFHVKLGIARQTGIFFPTPTRKLAFSERDAAADRDGPFRA